MVTKFAVEGYAASRLFELSHVNTLLESTERVSEPSGRALEPARRVFKQAGIALEPAGRPGANWEGQQRGNKKERSWYVVVP